MFCFVFFVLRTLGLIQSRLTIAITTKYPPLKIVHVLGPLKKIFPRRLLGELCLETLTPLSSFPAFFLSFLPHHFLPRMSLCIVPTTSNPLYHRTHTFSPGTLTIYVDSQLLTPRTPTIYLLPKPLLSIIEPLLFMPGT